MNASKKLTPAAISRAAKRLRVQEAAVRALLTVEAPDGGFLPDGQVTILFEPHKFSEYTNRRFDKSHPDLSYPVWGTRPYGKRSEQHAKLQRAVALDRDAALRATSYGIPQILGNNWKKVGCSSLQDFINKMFSGEDAQLDLMVNFIKSDNELWSALKTSNWPVVARKYNGTAYAKNQYDKKLAAAFRNNGGV